MTECTGRKYWRDRIRQCIGREQKRFGQRISTLQFTMTREDLAKLTAWHLAWVDYLKATSTRWGRSAK